MVGRIQVGKTVSGDDCEAKKFAPKMIGWSVVEAWEPPASPNSVAMVVAIVVLPEPRCPVRQKTGFRLWSVAHSLMISSIFSRVLSVHVVRATILPLVSTIAL